MPSLVRRKPVRLPGSLIRSEVIQGDPSNGSADSGPELILLQVGSRLTGPIAEEIIGIQEIIPEEFKDTSMQSVRA